MQIEGLHLLMVFLFSEYQGTRHQAYMYVHVYITSGLTPSSEKNCQ